MPRITGRLKELFKSLQSWVIVAAGLGLAWLLLHGIGAPAKTEKREREQKVVPITVAEIMPRQMHHSVQVVGTMRGFEEVDVTAKVDGQVYRIYKDVGDVVKPGEVLLELDPRDYELMVQEAQRSLELELSRLQSGLKKVPETFDITTVPGVRRAFAQEKNAKLRRQRVKMLGSAATREEQESAERDEEIAMAEHKQALLDAEATLAAARFKQATLATAMQKLKDSRVIVPESFKESALHPVTLGSEEGPEFVICQRTVSEGQVVRPFPGVTQPLFKLAIVRTLKLKASVSERYYSQIKAGQKATLRVEAYPGETFHGEVVRKSPSIDKSSRSFEVEIHVPNEDRRLSPGAFARASLFTRVDDKAPTVPEEAIVRFAGVTKVFVLEKDRVKEMQVTLGASMTVTSDRDSSTWVELLTPLPPGTRVVTSGQTQLADGTPVRLR